MQAEYRREMNHSYLVLKAGSAVNPQGYEIKMLLHNQPPGLLPLSVRYIDGEPLFYYEVTSRQSIFVMYEAKKFGRADLEQIFRAAADIMEGLEEYLLDVGTILFNPKYIYMDTERQHLYFCCFPAERNQEQSGILELTEYILPKIDHKDAGAVVLGYGVYRESVETGTGADEIRRELRKVSRESVKEEEYREKRVCAEQEFSGEPVMTEEKRKQALDAFFEEEEDVEEKHPLLNAVGCIFSGVWSKMSKGDFTYKMGYGIIEKQQNVVNGKEVCYGRSFPPESTISADRRSTAGNRSIGTRNSGGG